MAVPFTTRSRLDGHDCFSRICERSGATAVGRLGPPIPSWQRCGLGPPRNALRVSPTASAALPSSILIRKSYPSSREPLIKLFQSLHTNAGVEAFGAPATNSLRRLVGESVCFSAPGPCLAEEWNRARACPLVNRSRRRSRQPTRFLSARRSTIAATRTDYDFLRSFPFSLHSPTIRAERQLPS